MFLSQFLLPFLQTQRITRSFLLFVFTEGFIEMIWVLLLTWFGITRKQTQTHAHIYTYYIYGSFHVKWTRISKVGIWPISDSDETFPGERYIWDKRKFQHKLIAHSKVKTPQSWHHKLKIDKTKGSGSLDAFLSLSNFFCT